MYMMSLGEYDVDNYKRGVEDRPVWILFIIVTYITQIVFLNMLIAIMGNTYDRVMERVKQASLKE